MRIDIVYTAFFFARSTADRLAKGMSAAGRESLISEDGSPVPIPVIAYTESSSNVTVLDVGSFVTESWSDVTCVWVAAICAGVPASFVTVSFSAVICAGVVDNALTASLRDAICRCVQFGHRILECFNLRLCCS